MAACVNACSCLYPCMQVEINTQFMYVKFNKMHNNFRAIVHPLNFKYRVLSKIIKIPMSLSWLFVTAGIIFIRLSSSFGTRLASTSALGLLSLPVSLNDKRENKDH